ncbi:hypothetical protein, partial [Ruthenibacterium lactatiformans]|uniref:hypothetical protein n=1 Tax=Ruthenibacterium lactatiformans TaxID=1550024 RepID=UPI0027BAD44D
MTRSVKRRVDARKHRFWADGFGAQRTQKVWQSTKDCQAFFAQVNYTIKCNTLGEQKEVHT